MSISTDVMLEQRQIEDFQRWARESPRNKEVAHSLDMLMADLCRFLNSRKHLGVEADLHDSICRWANANDRANEDHEQRDMFEHALAKDD